jgi:hypothetical protein
MRKKLILLGLALATAAGLQAGLFSPAAQAASDCFKVDCNTCCRYSNGMVACTQMACVDDW